MNRSNQTTLARTGDDAAPKFHTKEQQSQDDIGVMIRGWCDICLLLSFIILIIVARGNSGFDPTCGANEYMGMAYEETEVTNRRIADLVSGARVNLDISVVTFDPTQIVIDAAMTEEKRRSDSGSRSYFSGTETRPIEEGLVRLFNLQGDLSVATVLTNMRIALSTIDDRP
ncbi:hypothetical protein EDD18DRAFT_1107667 [Armillaria luteobubalina]|uniref:Uncharacterized protein n=1 Tax=Armillaria luteobubalina TaxID=153913 RepID=A0AA39Q0U3_9AGAR|nr:hypothetical protein EDD18DRAFT_1107667 [Armillaria luteobubalina]